MSRGGVTAMGEPSPITLDHLRTLPDGSLTRAEVNLLIDYIEKLEARLIVTPALAQHHRAAHDGPGVALGAKP